MDLRIYSAHVMTTGGIYQCDVIHHDERFWLVPHWLEYPEVQVSLPMLVIPLDEWPHEAVPQNRQGMNFVVNGPLPIALFLEDADEAPEAQRYVEAVVDDMRRRRPNQMT
jgi:hypothetical protein